MSLRLSLYRLDAVEPELLASVPGWLEPDQRVRAERFATAALRRRFLAAQARLRQHLGQQLGVSPERLVVSRDEYGKPRLIEHADLHFSLSHSGEWALVGSAPVELGVDIEAEIGMSRHAVAAEFLDPGTLAEFQRRDPTLRPALLTRAWCAREALLKLDGRGLRLDPRSLRVALDLPATATWDGDSRHALAQALPAPADFHACIASHAPLAVPPQLDPQ